MTFFKKAAVMAFVLLLPLRASYAYDSLEEPFDDGKPKVHRDIYHLYDDVEMMTNVKVKFYKPRITVRITFPDLKSDEFQDSVRVFNESIDAIVKDEIQQFRDQVKSVNDANPNLMAKFKKRKRKPRNNLYMDYGSSTMMSGNSPIISVRMNIQGFVIGAAHPYHHHRIVNYDADNMREIQLHELFLPSSNYLQIIAQYCRNILAKRLENQSMVWYGTSANMKNFEVWNIRPEGLMFTFNEGQVAPYVNGAQRVLVPYSVLEGVISPHSILASCVLNRKTCSSHSLMTGGFLDQA